MTREERALLSLRKQCLKKLADNCAGDADLDGSVESLQALET
jgi:hypothetical protein